MASFQDNWSSQFLAQKNSRTATPITIVDVHLGAQEEVDSDTLFFNDSNYNFNYYPYRDMTNTQSYIALGLNRGAISKSLSSTIDSLSITLDNVSRTFSTLFSQVDLRGKRVVIREVYPETLDASGDFDLLFDGILDSPEMSLEDGARMTVRPGIMESLQFKIPKELYQIHCPNRFIGAECANGIASSTLLDEATSQTIDEVISQIHFRDAARTEGDTHYNPGIIEMTGGTVGNINERRRIVDMSGDNMFIDRPFPSSVQVGDEYSIQRDCDRTFEECRDKFSNDANFRGFRYLPQTLESA